MGIDHSSYQSAGLSKKSQLPAGHLQGLSCICCHCSGRSFFFPARKKEERNGRPTGRPTQRGSQPA